MKLFKNEMVKHLFVGVLTIGLMGCGSSASESSSEDVKTKIEALKKEKAQIELEIKELAAQLPEADSRKATLVSAKAIKPQKFEHFVKLQGRVESDYNVLVSSRSSGIVSEILVEPGTTVNKNQVLAKLENDVLRKNVEEVKTSLDFATTVFEKQQRLWDQNIGSEMQLLTAKNNKETLERRLSTLYEQMELNNVKSPIFGKVEDVILKVGELTTPGMPAFRVVNDKDLKVTAEVSESYIDKINAGNEVVVEFPDLGKTLKSKIISKAEVIDPINRTFTVEVEIPNKDKSIRPNMVAVLNIRDYQNSKALVIPQNVIQKSNGKSFVYVARGDSSATAEKAWVDLGIAYKGQVEIKSGLKEGEKVITQGYMSVNPGDAVNLSLN